MTFMRMLLAQLFISSQTASPLVDFATNSEAEAETLSRDREVLELIMVRTIKQASVVQGVLRFVKDEGSTLVSSAKLEGIQNTIQWAIKVAQDTLGAGAEVSTML